MTHRTGALSLLLASLFLPFQIWAQDSAGASVQDALLAQVIGLGGCIELESIESVDVRFFPQVRFWQGTCTLEHGGTAKPLAAMDTTGLVYVLDSESSFAFLVRRHPPTGLSASSAVDYVALALTMQGKLPMEAHILRTREDTPRALCEAIGLACDGLFLSRYDSERKTVLLTAFTDQAIYSAGPIIVYLNSGIVYAVVEERMVGGKRLR